MRAKTPAVGLAAETALEMAHGEAVAFHVDMPLAPDRADTMNSSVGR